MQHLAVHVRSTPYLPFVFVRGDVNNDVIVYLHKLKFSNVICVGKWQYDVYRWHNCWLSVRF